LQLAFRHNRDFPYLRHSGPAGILNHGQWQSAQYAGLSWLLMPGDFLETMATAPGPPDLIFYDMFSSRTSGDQWTLQAFRRLFDACAGRAAELFTYSCSTANRVALLAAGFYVARGRNAGEKAETTIALTPAAYRATSPCRHELLSADWLGKWHRSRVKYPAEITADKSDAFEQVIREHEQFQPT
jgi:queuine tRNA-ribosyltransferase